MPSNITIKADDTDPIEYTIGATGLDDLSDLDTAEIYILKAGAATNHVDGVAVSIHDSATRTLAFDPVDAKNGGGDALDEAGVYRAYTKATWTDGRETRHPGKGFITITVQANYE